MPTTVSNAIRSSTPSIEGNIIVATAAKSSAQRNSLSTQLLRLLALRQGFGGAREDHSHVLGLYSEMLEVYCQA